MTLSDFSDEAKSGFDAIYIPEPKQFNDEFDDKPSHIDDI